MCHQLEQHQALRTVSLESMGFTLHTEKTTPLFYQNAPPAPRVHLCPDGLSACFRASHICTHRSVFLPLASLLGSIGAVSTCPMCRCLLEIGQVQAEQQTPRDYRRHCMEALAQHRTAVGLGHRFYPFPSLGRLLN